MNDIVTLALPTHTLLRLLQYAASHPDGPSAAELATQAINAWLNQAASGPKPGIRHRGYQWKTLFLPEGTQLKAWNRERFAYAEVIDDAILFQGQSVSPHQFICRCKGISRNAWTEIGLLFPDSDKWQTAAACRKDLAGRAQRAAPVAQLLAPVSPTVQAAPAQPQPVVHRARLPRVQPIPTQARLHPAAAAVPTPIEELLPDAHDRRCAYRRAEDLLLD